jgi:hypothetical protein
MALAKGAGHEGAFEVAAARDERINLLESGAWGGTKVRGGQNLTASMHPAQCTAK